MPENLVRLIMCLCTESNTRVRRPQECGDYFEIKVGEHQGSALRPLLLIIKEEATRNCRSMIPLDMLYADDFVVSAETES